MRSAVQKSSLNRQIILFQIFWGLFALLFFLLFSASTTQSGYPVWYQVGTSILELVAFFTATVLCLRNAFSPQIVSGRRVWLGIGLGMLLYFIGNLIFTYWEIGLAREADVTPGDLFYVASYVCLIISMAIAAFERRLNLEGWQYGTILAVGVVGTVIAFLLAQEGNAKPVAQANAFLLNPLQVEPAIATTVPTDNPPPMLQLAQAPKKPAASTPKKPAATPKAEPAETAGTADNAPAWAIGIENTLQPFKKPLSFLYLIADTILLIIATTLFLAYWGGRFAQSWRLIAAATFFLYLADAWFKFAITYQSGGLLEVGWVLSAVLFGIGAALELDLSQSRRSSARRRGVA
jgi:hypothetical protein